MNSGIRTISYILLLLLCVGFYFHAWGLDFISDDSFITLRYAKNLRDGQGFVYNIGERVDGYVDFLWIFLLSLFGRLGFDLLETSRIFGLLLGFGTIVLSFRLSLLCAGKHSLLNLLLPACVALNTSFAAYSICGLETSCLTFTLIAALAFYLSEGQKGPAALPISALFLAASAMNRPEGAIMGGVLFVHLWGEILLKRARERMRYGVIFSLLFLLPYGAYFIWRWIYYGDILPNVYYAKVGTGLAQYNRGLDYTYNFLADNGGVVFLLLPLLLFPFKIRERWFQTCTLGSLFLFLYIIYIGGDGLPLFRFFVPALPMIFLLVQEGLRFILQNLPVEGGKGHAFFAAFTVAAGGLLLILSSFFPQRSNVFYRMFLGQRNAEVPDWTLVGKWLKKSGEAPLQPQ